MDKEEKLKYIIKMLGLLEVKIIKLELGYKSYHDIWYDIKVLIDNIINRINLIDVQLISVSEEKYLDGIHNNLNKVEDLLTHMQPDDLKPSKNLNIIKNSLFNIKSLLIEVSKEVLNKLPVISLEKAKKSISDRTSGFRDEIKQNKKEYNTLTDKTLEYDKLLKEKTSAYDTLTKKTLEYDELLKEKTSAYDKLLKEKTSTYDTLTKKTLEYDKLLTEKTSAYDKLLTEKTSAYDELVKEKTSAHDELLIEKTSAYDELVKKIEKIMPGAISAGLGEDFSKQKESLETKIGNWSILFFVAIASLILFGVWAIWHVEKVDDIADYSYSLLPKIPMFTALVWFASYVSKRRSEYNRLAQEYTHKEVVAKSYGSCKKQTEGADPKLLESLLKNTIESIAYNPSGTLDRKHGDKMPVQELLKKLYEICKKLKKGE